MEPFEINLAGNILHVIPQEDGSYLIKDAEVIIGTLIPENDDLGILWTTFDLIAPDYVKQIGELIEEHDL